MAEPLRAILGREPWAAVEGFLRRWHGWSPPRTVLPGAETVPGPLRRVYATLGSAPALYTLNQLLAPRDGSRPRPPPASSSCRCWS